MSQALASSPWAPFQYLTISCMQQHGSNQCGSGVSKIRPTYEYQVRAIGAQPS